MSKDSIDDFVAREMNQRFIPGLALAIIHERKVRKLEVYGLANAEFEVPVSSNTLFAIASLTKVFTSAAVLSLAEAGKLGLDDPVKHYVSELPDSWTPVTLRHCLSHTTGLPDAVTEIGGVVPIGNSLQEVLEELYLRKVSPPGQSALYNQTGYMLLRMVVEEITGRTFEEHLQASIFEPLKMNDTTFGDDRDLIRRQASLYTKLVPSFDRASDLPGPVAPNDPFGSVVISPDRIFKDRTMFPVICHAGAGMITTIEDMAKWDVALSEGKVISPSSLVEAGTAFALNDGTPGTFGLGWIVTTTRRGSRHVYMIGGWTSSYLRIPEVDLSVIVLTNLRGAERGEMANGIAELALK